MSEEYLITTSTCPNCPAAKNYVKENNLTHIKIVEADTSEDNMKLAMSFGVTSVPTFVIKDDNGIQLLSLQEYANR